MIFEQISIGGDRNFAYLIGDEKEKVGALVDASLGPEMALARSKEHGLKIQYVIATHDHSDHSGANDVLRRLTGAKVVMHSNAESPSDIAANDGDELPLGSLSLKIIYTPGHTLDSICILAETKLVSGDTLFVGKVGGTDFGESARLEYESLHKKLMTLDDHVEVYPGHDYGVAPTSTIGHEKSTNPFLLRKTLEDFIDLKKNWLEYKTKHGIK